MYSVRCSGIRCRFYFVKNVKRESVLINCSGTNRDIFPAPQPCPPVFVSFTGAFSALDINTGLFAAIAAGESSNTSRLVQNDDNGNMIVNVMYGNYRPPSSGINIYATGLYTGQVKWDSKPLPYNGI